MTEVLCSDCGYPQDMENDYCTNCVADMKEVPCEICGDWH